MNYELKSKIKRKNKMWIVNKSMNWTEPSKIAEYNKLKIEVKHDIKSSVRAFECNIANNFKSQPKLLYKYINEKRTTNNTIGAIQSSNGDIVVDVHSITTELKNYFQSVYIDDVDTNLPPVIDKVTENKLTEIEFTQKEIE